MTERWLPVPGFPNYEVSSEGRVRSLDHMRRCGPYGMGLQKGRVLRAGVGGNGYLIVVLGIGKSRGVSRTVHSLVAEAFIGPRPAGHEVRHKDGNRINPRLNNLEYGTPSENVQDAIRHGTYRSGFRENPGRQYRDADSYRRGWETRRRNREPSV